jgi:hypothetical protein
MDLCLPTPDPYQPTAAAASKFVQLFAAAAQLGATTGHSSPQQPPRGKTLVSHSPEADRFAATDKTAG